MAEVVIRVRPSDCNVILDKFSNSATVSWRATCCCGWRGNRQGARTLAVGEAQWHLDHMPARFLYWIKVA